MNADGTNQHYIGIEGFSPEWLQNGTKFIYSSDKSGNSEIYSCNINGTGENRLTNSAIQETFPDWSHDRAKIIFSAYSGTSTNSSEIYLMDADGANPIRLTENTNFEFYPRWSPDDTKISFISDRSSANHYEVYLMNLNGSNSIQLTNTAEPYSSSFPTWKPI